MYDVFRATVNISVDFQITSNGFHLAGFFRYSHGGSVVSD